MNIRHVRILIQEVRNLKVGGEAALLLQHVAGVEVGVVHAAHSDLII